MIGGAFGFGAVGSAMLFTVSGVRGTRRSDDHGTIISFVEKESTALCAVAEPFCTQEVGGRSRSRTVAATCRD